MTRTLAACLIAAALAAPATAAPQHESEASRGALMPGPHGVGFRMIAAMDSTRSFRPARDFRGRPADWTARPVQVSVWYPARGGNEAGPSMPAGAFRLLAATELDPTAPSPPRDSDRLRTEFVARAVELGADRAAAERVWDEPTLAVRGAPPLPGPHPSVLYFTSAGVNNPVLPAYLASHGFVVASFPSNGRMTDVALEFTPNALTLDTDVDDAGFVLAVLRRLEFADAGRLGIVAFSGGSLAALLWQMRDMQAGAVVTMEGWERFRRGADIMAGSVHSDLRRIRVPMLVLERAGEESSPDYARVPDVVERLPYADVTRVAFRDADHGDFLSHLPDGRRPHQGQVYRTSARLIRTFLEAALARGARDPWAPEVLSSQDPDLRVTRDPPVGPVPTEEELFRLAEIDPAAALEAYRTAARVVPGSELFREHVLTRAALFAPDAEARATIMEVVVDAYPTSAAARLRLGEALLEAGRPRAAVVALNGALETVARDPSLSEQERASLRDRVRAALEGAGAGM